MAAESESGALAVTVRAEAQAKANALLAQSLTPALIQYQQLQQWDGRLPVFQGSNASPLIDVSSFVPAPSTAPTPDTTP
ncbi:MAG: hypothetical protein H0T73_23680 [Ardenticatenales bacterium]|nr:hypothetical protein [Ardenticatenales bacterium]